MVRKIIHIDMDAFFAAVEIRDNPKLKNKAVIVGGDPDKRGVVATCNYIARSYGIRSAMAASIAKVLCPRAVFIKPRFEAYRYASSQVMGILARITDNIEPVSIDEAYLDVSNVDDFQGSATLIAHHLRAQIFKETRLTASAGVSYNKFLAKLASELKKPDGLSIILPNEGLAFIEALAIGKFHGIGRATEKKMHALGIKIGADLAHLSEQQLALHFGKVGAFYYQLARGIDLRPVKSDHERKSFGAEITLEQDQTDLVLLKAILLKRCEEICALLQKNNLKAASFTLKVKYSNFEQVTRSLTLPQGFDNINQLIPYLDFLIQKTQLGKQPVRLIGASASHLISATFLASRPVQLCLPF